MEQCFCVSDSQVREQFEEARAEAVQGVGLVQISQASTVEVFQVVNNHMVQHRYVESDCLKLLLFSVVKKMIYIYIYINLCTLPSAKPSIL